MEIVQIVPQFPPVVNGLGDYAFLLARELQSFHDIRSKIIVGDPRRTLTESEGFITWPIARRTASALLEVLEADGTETALLHYVGYGYAKRGSPFWLVDGICRWRLSSKRRRLVVIFHELFAFGPPWRSSFWTSPLQKWLVRRLVAAMDHGQTAMQSHANLLRSWAQKSTSVLVTPNFSGVGEPIALRPLGERKRQIVVFGSRAIRMLTYSQHSSELLKACGCLNLNRIVDVGATEETIPELPVPIFQAGLLSSAAVREILSESVGGFLSYFNGYLAKSSVFAAYCACGIVPILPDHNRSESDGLEMNRHYLAMRSVPADCSDEQLQAIADAANKWYSDHSLTRTASALAILIRGRTIA